MPCGRTAQCHRGPDPHLHPRRVFCPPSPLCFGICGWHSPFPRPRPCRRSVPWVFLPILSLAPRTSVLSLWHTGFLQSLETKANQSQTRNKNLFWFRIFLQLPTRFSTLYKATQEQSRPVVVKLIWFTYHRKNMEKLCTLKHIFKLASKVVHFMFMISSITESLSCIHACRCMAFTLHEWSPEISQHSLNAICF